MKDSSLRLFSLRLHLASSLLIGYNAQAIMLLISMRTAISMPLSVLFFMGSTAYAQENPVGYYESVHGMDGLIRKSSFNDCFRSEVSFPERCIKVVKVTSFAVRASDGQLYCHHGLTPVLNPPLKGGYGRNMFKSVCTSRGWVDQYMR